MLILNFVDALIFIIFGIFCIFHLLSINILHHDNILQILLEILGLK